VRAISNLERIISRLDFFHSIAVEPIFNILFITDIERNNFNFLTVLSVYLLSRKRYITSILVILSAFYLRPYSIAAIGIYVLYFRRDFCLALLGLAGSIINIVAYSGTFLIAINTVAIFIFMFFTPLPIEHQNWFDPTAGLRTLESAIYGSAFAVSLVIVLVYREVRIEYFLLAFGICIYATVMALIGFHRINTGILGISYDYITIGSHVARKKSLVHPLIVIWVTITIQVFRHRLPNIKLKY